MRTREDTLRSGGIHRGARSILGGASTLALVCLPGCGAIFHSSQSVQIVPKPEDKAVVYAAGVPLASNAGTFTVPVFLTHSLSGEPLAISEDGRIAPAKLERTVSGAAVVCDVLWSLTIVGLAAPISDALLGTFQKTKSPVEVTFKPNDTSPNPMPTYAVEGALVPAVPEPVVVRAKPPSSPPASSTSASPPASASAAPPPASPAKPPTKKR